MRAMFSLGWFLLAFCSGQASHAEITKVEGRHVEIRLGGKTVVTGERLEVLDGRGFEVGVVKIVEFGESRARAEIQSGTVAVGMKVARRVRVNVEGGSRSAERDDNYAFRLNPIGLTGGSIAANFDFRILNAWTLGPQGAYLKLSLNPSGIFTSKFDISAWGVGLRANWFINGAFKTGFYLGPSLEYLAVTVKTTDAFGAARGQADGLLAAALVGYGWFQHGFNFMLGGGYGTVLGASGITIQDVVGNQQTIVANLSGLTYELSVGYAF